MMSTIDAIKQVIRWHRGREQAFTSEPEWQKKTAAEMADFKARHDADAFNRIRRIVEG